MDVTPFNRSLLLKCPTGMTCPATPDSAIPVGYMMPLSGDLGHGFNMNFRLDEVSVLDRVLPALMRHSWAGGAHWVKLYLPLGSGEQLGVALLYL